MNDTNAIVPATPDALVPHNIMDAVQLANMMAKAKMVPQHLHDDPGTCLMVVEQAMRWHMSPFAVAQCTSNIKGKLMYEGKLVAAACQAIGAIEGHFDYSFTGEGDTRAVTVKAVRTGEKNPREITAVLKDVKTDNEMWRRQPDQQLVYSGTRIWARRWAPAAILGVYVPEEFNKGDIIEGSAVELKPGEINTATGTEAPLEQPKPKQSDMRDRIDAFIAGFKVRCMAAVTSDDAEAILKDGDIMKGADWLSKKSPDDWREWCKLRDAMLLRFYKPAQPLTP